jgi:predicted RNase H-like HicB family nuclease
MFTEYVRAALRHAKYEILQDDGSYYAEIPDCVGVYANANTLEECREELQEVLEEWILFRVYKNLPLPVIDGAEIAIRETV